MIPERYTLREKEGLRFLECDEAPRLRAVIDPEMSVSRAEAAALGERVILLDGAGSFGPLIDNDAQLYNLDHHAGCERLFTLSTCEQALLLVESGLELGEGDWTLYANDPDLDTVLALWCLLNYRRLRELPVETRDVLLPLLRLEGAIDANGPELAALCGLPSGVLEQARRHIDDLLARERALKQSGAWANKNVHGYTLEMLRAVDALVYSPDDFGDHTRIGEIYGYTEIAPRKVAVACRDRSGIYTVEQHLKSRWGDQLALIALENQKDVYTLRRVSSISGPALEPAYAWLNRIDPAVDGRPPGKRWGGSRDIGGSPRPHGTQLAPGEILEALGRAYAPWSWWRRAGRSAAALAVGLGFALFWPLAALLPSLAGAAGVPGGAQAAFEVAFGALLALGTGMLAIRAASGRRPWAFGFRLPAWGGGLWLAPLALAGALPVAAWTTGWLAAGSGPFAAALAAGALSLLAMEVWFRGLAHGMLALDFEVQAPGTSFRISRAALVSSLAYAAVALGWLEALGAGGWSAPTGWSGAAMAAFAVAAFAVGLSLAVIRERTLSLLPGIALQLAGLGLATAVGWLLHAA